MKQMARRQEARPRRGRKTIKKVPPTITTQIVLRVTDETPQYYINHAEVASSQHEFSLYGTYVPTKVPPELIDSAQELGVIHREALFQIVMPISLMDGLINALKKQKDFYEEHLDQSRKNGGKKSVR